MGMYNELNNIKRAVDQQAIEMKKTQEHQKRVEYVKNELDGLLWAELVDKNNVFDNEVKAIAIDSVVSNTDVLLYNKDYTRQYLNKKYYTIARQVEQIQKKTAPQNQDDYKKQIAIEKWNIQRERERVKLQIEAERLKQLQQKQIQKQYKPVQTRQPQRYYTPIRSGSGSEIAKVLIYLMFAPIAIFGIIIYGFISAAAKSK